MGLTDVLTYLSIIAGTIGLQGLLIKWVDRRQAKATVRHTDAQTTALEVETMRGIVQEVRASDAAKSEQIARLESRMGEMETHLRSIQISLVPLNAWALAAHAVILPHNPDFPPPPIIDGAPPPTGRVIAEIVTKESL